MSQQYTHLLPKEIAIWERFLAAYGDLFKSFDYDIHLGPGAELPDDAPDWVIRQSQAVSRDRVDVVGHRGDAIWIIEIKPRAGKGAIGQLIQYRRQYIEELAPARPVRMVIVCERVAPGVQATCDNLGIGIIVV